MAKIVVVQGNCAGPIPPYVDGGGGGDQPIPPGFTGILPASDGTQLHVDANERFTDAASGFSTSNNAVYRFDASGAFANNGTARRVFDDAYCKFVRLDALRGSGATGTISLKVTRVSDSVVVYTQDFSSVGADDNSYDACPAVTLPGNVYRCEVENKTSGLVAFDGLTFSR